MNWIHYSLISSMLWGISYAIGERLLKVITIPTLMLFNAVGSLIFAIIYTSSKNTLKEDISLLNYSYVFMILFCTLANIGASWLVNVATQEKNATMAGLIEISYPFFSAITAYVLFGDKQLNIQSFFGAVLIMFGVLIISRF